MNERQKDKVVGKYVGIIIKPSVRPAASVGYLSVHLQADNCHRGSGKRVKTSKLTLLYC